MQRQGQRREVIPDCMTDALEVGSEGSVPICSKHRECRQLGCTVSQHTQCY